MKTDGTGHRVRLKFGALGAIALAFALPLLTIVPPVTGTALAGATTAMPTPARGVKNGSGLLITSRAHLDTRLLSFTVSTAALPHSENIRILLPTDYGTHPQRRYPVLYLLDGTSGKASDWVSQGHAEQITAGIPVIVVMPDITHDGDGGGWCTNWVNGGHYGKPEWETFHIDQVVPWIDRNFRTVNNRGERSIAGLSQGGFCSTSYAAQFPDLFGAVSAYSGAVDTTSNGFTEGGVRNIINATELTLDHVAKTSMFGNPSTYQLNWADHDPSKLAINLRNSHIYLYNGNGRIGPYTHDRTSSTGLETDISFDNSEFHQTLLSLQIKSTWNHYGPGSHSWPYWTRDLKENLPKLMKDMAHPETAPSSFTYITADPTYSIYGWSVTTHRPDAEFSEVQHVSHHGFSLLGSGSADVVSAPLFKPSQRYSVTFDGASIHSVEQVHADRKGRLHISVPLGPGNPDQEYAPGSTTKVETTNVHIGAK